MLQPITRVLTFFEQVCMYAAQAALFLMMLAISADAMGRYLLNTPLPGGFDAVSLYFMVILAFLAMPGTYSLGGHIRLDVIAPALNKMTNNLPERINAAVSCAVFGFIAFYSSQDAIHKFVENEMTFGTIQFPLYWSYIWVPVGATVLTLRLFTEIFDPQTLNPDAI